MRSMLSFNNGKPIAHGIDKRGNKVLTINITPEQETEDIDMSDFISSLEKLGDAAFDYVEMMKKYFKKNKTNKSIKEIILDAMEKE